MEPISFTVLVFLAAFATAKMITNYKIDREYARQGLDSPRMRLKLDKAARGEVGPEAVDRTRPGAAGYFRELWDDAWEDATTRHREGRAEKEAAKARGETPAERKSWWRWLWDPIGEDQAGQTTDESYRPATGAARQHLWQAVEEGAEEDSAPEPAKEPKTEPATRPTPAPNPDPGQPTRGDTVPAPAEVNFEAAVTAHEATLARLQAQLDRATALRTHLASAGGQVDGMDAERHQLKQQTTSLLEGMEEQQLDASSLEGADAATDALSASTIASVEESIESATQQNDQWIAALEASIAAVQASLNNIKSTYGDAAETMAATGARGSFVEAAA